MTETPSSQAFDALLEIFEQELEGVPFPDLGADTLRAARDAVDERVEAVLAREAELAAAREALEEARRLQTRLGRKALAYARVFAEDKPELDERLAGLGRELVSSVAPAAASSELPRRRGRPRKSEAAELFEAPEDAGTTPLASLAS